jgi:hypothetical protein
MALLALWCPCSQLPMGCAAAHGSQRPDNLPPKELRVAYNLPVSRVSVPASHPDPSASWHSKEKLV